VAGPGFRDLFSRDSASYAKFRPGYPAELFAWLANLPAQRRIAWDCATGSGQAALRLVPHFRQVVGTDASVSQLRFASRHQSLSYVACYGESSALRSGTVDLVTVAQAFHWLDHARFLAEVDRVIAPGGALAIVGYARLLGDPELEGTIRRFQDETVGPYWPPERKLVDEAYRGIAIPIREERAPEFAIRAELTLEQLLGYIGTWSAVGRYRETTGRDPLPGLERELLARWGDPRAPRRVRWPLFVRAGRWDGDR
jgi:SAM-dependent methyltransferase